jgi:hypothetical protein
VIARNLLKNLAENFFKNQLAMSGKSPAYLHRRKNSKSPRREIGRGFCYNPAASLVVAPCRARSQ